MKNPLRAVSKDESLSFRFTLPVVAENVLTIFIGLLFSRIISTISASALAAIGMSNTVMAVVSALFSVVTTGAAVGLPPDWRAGRAGRCGNHRAIAVSGASEQPRADRSVHADRAADAAAADAHGGGSAL